MQTNTITIGNIQDTVDNSAEVETSITLSKNEKNTVNISNHIEINSNSNDNNTLSDDILSNNSITGIPGMNSLKLLNIFRYMRQFNSDKKNTLQLSQIHVSKFHNLNLDAADKVNNIRRLPERDPERANDLQDVDNEKAIKENQSDDTIPSSIIEELSRQDKNKIGLKTGKKYPLESGLEDDDSINRQSSFKSQNIESITGLEIVNQFYSENEISKLSIGSDDISRDSIKSDTNVYTIKNKYNNITTIDEINKVSPSSSISTNIDLDTRSKSVSTFNKDSIKEDILLEDNNSLTSLFDPSTTISSLSTNDINTKQLYAQPSEQYLNKQIQKEIIKYTAEVDKDSITNDDGMRETLLSLTPNTTISSKSSDTKVVLSSDRTTRWERSEHRSAIRERYVQIVRFAIPPYLQEENTVTTKYITQVPFDKIREPLTMYRPIEIIAKSKYEQLDIDILTENVNSNSNTKQDSQMIYKPGSIVNINDNYDTAIKKTRTFFLRKIVIPYGHYTGTKQVKLLMERINLQSLDPELLRITQLPNSLVTIGNLQKEIDNDILKYENTKKKELKEEDKYIYESGVSTIPSSSISNASFYRQRDNCATRDNYRNRNTKYIEKSQTLPLPYSVTGITSIDIIQYLSNPNNLQLLSDDDKSDYNNTVKLSQNTKYLSKSSKSVQNYKPQKSIQQNKYNDNICSIVKKELNALENMGQLSLKILQKGCCVYYQKNDKMVPMFLSVNAKGDTLILRSTTVKEKTYLNSIDPLYFILTNHNNLSNISIQSHKNSTISNISDCTKSVWSSLFIRNIKNIPLVDIYTQNYNINQNNTIYTYMLKYPQIKPWLILSIVSKNQQAIDLVFTCNDDITNWVFGLQNVIPLNNRYYTYGLILWTRCFLKIRKIGLQRFINSKARYWLSFLR